MIASPTALLEPGSAEAVAVGFRIASTVDLRLGERWRLAFSLGFSISRIVGGEFGKEGVVPTTSPLYGLTPSLGLIGSL